MRASYQQQRERTERVGIKMSFSASFIATGERHVKLSTASGFIPDGDSNTVAGYVSLRYGHNTISVHVGSPDDAFRIAMEFESLGRDWLESKVSESNLVTQQEESTQ
jgi:hypothetical protein